MKPIKAEEPETTATSLHRATVLIVSLLSSSSDSTFSFPNKWQTIRSKLHDLLSALDAIAAATSSTRSGSIANLVLEEFLRDISATVRETRDLALATAGGRLLMLSNLHLAMTKLDLHCNSLAGLYSAGVLAFASPPTPTKTHEEPKLYIRHLCSSLSMIGFNVMSRALAAALNAALRNDQSYVRVVAVDVPEALQLLVNSLTIKDEGTQEEAAEAVSLISTFDCHRKTLTYAGSIPALLKVLENGSELGKERAAGALRNLTENSDNAWAISAEDGVPILLKALREGGDTTGRLLRSACGVLKNLADVPEIRAFMAEKGAVGELVNLVDDGERSIRVKEVAVEALSKFVSVQRNQRRLAEESDGKPVTAKLLLSALASLSDGDEPRRKVAVSAYVRSLEKIADRDGRKIEKKVPSGGSFRSFFLHPFWRS